MKKRLLSILLAALLLAAILPTAAFAASDFEKTYFPGGKINTPKAPYLVYEKNDLYDDLITLWYNPSEELRTLRAAEGRYQDSGKEFEEYFGVYSYEVAMQIDAKIDNGSWQYTSAWDDPEWSGLEELYGLDFCTYTHPGTDALYEEMTLSDLHYLGEDPAFLAPAVYTGENAYGETIYHYDLSGHTLSVRYRYVVCISPEYGECDMVFSDWSPVTSIGKNGTQKLHTAPAALAAPVLSDFNIVKYEDGGTSGEYFIDIPDSVYDAVLYCEADLDAFEPMYLQAQMRVNGGEWADVYTANSTWIFDGFRSAAPDGEALKESDAVEVRVKIVCDCLGMVSAWSNIVGTKTAYQASDWAQNYIAQADELGLIPDCLDGADLTQKITRKEFAALAVKVYEKMSGNTSVAPGAAFADCTDEEVLKAVAIGITNGTDTAKNLFSPNANITREQCAAMLARAYKASAFEGWTLAADADYSTRFKESFTMPEKFADDAKISAYAKDSVYFMAANGIINGVGNNLFAPVGDTTKSDAYGMATREAAIKIAVGMVTNLK